MVDVAGNTPGTAALGAIDPPVLVGPGSHLHHPGRDRSRPFALERPHALAGVASLTAPDACLLYRFPKPTPDGCTQIVLSLLRSCLSASSPSCPRPACTATGTTASSHLMPVYAPPSSPSVEPRPTCPAADAERSRPLTVDLDEFSFSTWGPSTSCNHSESVPSSRHTFRFRGMPHRTSISARAFVSTTCEPNRFPLRPTTASVQLDVSVRVCPEHMGPWDQEGRVIDLHSLGKSFDDGASFAVRDVTLHVASGQTLVLLGSSGSGKSTTLKMINRLLEPTEGSVELDGVDVERMDVVELRRSIGYVLQGIGLFPHMTLAENVAVVPRMLGGTRRNGGRAPASSWSSWAQLRGRCPWAQPGLGGCGVPGHHRQHVTHVA